MVDQMKAMASHLWGNAQSPTPQLARLAARGVLYERAYTPHPLCVPGSDATTLAPDGPLADTWFHGAYTWAAWFYRFMVRDQGLLEPAAAVHKLSGQPAARLGLRDRGVLRAGARADVAVFDPQRFGERGTTFEPNLLAEGMQHVVVNGCPRSATACRRGNGPARC